MTEAAREDVFRAAEFPSSAEVVLLEREIKRRARSKVVHCVHADILWRVRRGEPVSVERMTSIYPFCLDGLMRQYVQHLRDWGFLSEATPTLQLAETD